MRTRKSWSKDFLACFDNDVIIARVVWSSPLAIDEMLASVSNSVRTNNDESLGPAHGRRSLLNRGRDPDC